MLICTVLMLGQMEIAVPVLPLPPQGLGKAYVSILRLPWVSCQRLGCGMQMRKRVLFQKPHIGKIPPSLAEGGGHGGPCALLSCAPSAFWGSAGVARADAWASYISVPRYVLPTHATSPSAPRKSLRLRHRGKACHCRTAYFCLQARAQRPSELCPPVCQGVPQANQTPSCFIHFCRSYSPLTWPSSRALVMLYENWIFWIDVAKSVAASSCIKWTPDKGV